MGAAPVYLYAIKPGNNFGQYAIYLGQYNVYTNTYGNNCNGNIVMA
jgi:hypothetical protein